MGKLKPCPFCGSDNIFFDEGFSHRGKKLMYFLICDDCGVCSRAFLDKQSAIKWWNTRAAGWIKTSERLPKPFERVLGVFQYADEMFVASGKYRDIDISFVTDYEEGFWIKDVPYWMPLPEPPEVEE